MNPSPASPRIRPPVVLDATEPLHGTGPGRLHPQSRSDAHAERRGHPGAAAHGASCPGFGALRIPGRALRVVGFVEPVRAPLGDASREIENAVGADAVGIGGRRSRRVRAAVSRIAPPRVEVAPPGVGLRFVPPRGPFPFRFGREPPPGPLAERASLFPCDAGSREGLGHSPYGSLRGRLARRCLKELVLTPCHLDLVDEETIDTHRVTGMLRRLAFRICASHLVLPTWDANHDGAVLLAPELLRALWVAPQRTEPVRGGRG